MLLNKLVSILLVLAGVVSCSSPDRREVLLQIGAYQLTATDYGFIRNSAPYQAMTDAQVQEGLVEEGRMLAYALEHRFDTIDLLDRQLLHVLRYYASSVGGYVWNKTVKPLLRVTAEDIRSAYTLRDSAFYLESLYFPNKELLERYCPGGQLLQTVRDFNLLRAKTRTDPQVGSYSGERLYPFSPFGVYLPGLAKARAGTVWGPFESLSGYYVVHLTGKQPVKRGSLESEESRIRDELMQVIREKNIWESQQQILRTTKPFFRDPAIAAIASKANAQEKTWLGADPDMVLMEYYFQDRWQRFTASQFMEFVRSTPVFTGSLSNAGDVRKLLHSYLISIYLFEKGQQMGMEADPDYQVLSKRYQHSIFLRHYKQQHVYPRLSAGEAELERYYREAPDVVTGFDSAVISMYRFADLPGALAGRQLLLDQLAHAGRPSMRGSVAGEGRRLPIGDKLVVSVKDTLTANAVIDAISSLETGKVSMPVPGKGEFLVIFLHSKSGSAVMPYKYARESLRKALLAKKEKALIAALAAAYPVLVNDVAGYQANHGQ